MYTPVVKIKRTMAPKAKMLKSGDSITVFAHKVLGSHAASARYGIDSKTKRESGNITGSIMAEVVFENGWYSSVQK